MCFEDGYDAVESGSKGNAIVTPYYKSEVINSVLTARFIQTPSSLITRSVSVLNSYPPSGVSSGTSQGNIDFNDSFLENSRFPRSNKMLVYIFDINNFTINTSTIFACMELKNPSDTNIVTTETANRYKKYSIRTRTATASDDNQIFVGGCNEGSTGTERGVNIRYLAEDSLPTSSSGSKTFAYGSVFRLSSIPTTNSFMVSYPAEASVVGGDSWPGYIYENIGNRVRTGIYLVDFANLTGTISCKLTINVATSVFGSTARIGAECEINGNEIVTIIPGTNYDDLSTMPKVNTNQDYTYTYNISMNSSTYLDNQAIWIFVSNESGTVTLDHYIEIGEIDYYSQVGDLNIVPSSISKRQYDKLQLRNLYIKITGENSYTVEARQ